MKVLIVKPPKNGWWPNGLPIFEGNRHMQYAKIPDHDIVLEEYAKLRKTLKKAGVEVVEIEFPNELDREHNKHHDFVFSRDSFITDQDQRVVMARFSVERHQEAMFYEKILSDFGFSVHEVSPSARFEGGEAFFIPSEGILFCGTYRSNTEGNHEVAQILGVSEIIELNANAFHLDSVFTPVLNAENKLAAVIVCMEAMSEASQEKLRKFADIRGIDLVDIEPKDAEGLDGHLGQLATNCFLMPGVLIGPTKFETPGVEATLKNMGVKHIVTPLSQYAYSAGGVHCATNEI